MSRKRLSDDPRLRKTRLPGTTYIEWDEGARPSLEDLQKIAQEESALPAGIRPLGILPEESSSSDEADDRRETVDWCVRNHLPHSAEGG